MAAVMAQRLVCSIAPVEAILRLAKHVPVFPCRRSPEEVEVRGERQLRKEKSPLTEHGLRDASQDAQRIRAWWARWPDALVGVPTGSMSGLVVIDFDQHKADTAANDWVLEHSDVLCGTRTHSTLNGGHHYLFRLPDGTEYRNGVCLTLAGRKRIGIDVRAEGGYVIWWPLHGGSASGESVSLPTGLIEEQKVEPRELSPLPKQSPTKWAEDRKLVAGALAYLDPSDYGEWSRAGLAMHLASGGSDDGFSLWHAWSAGELTGDSPSNYSGINDCRYHWASYRHEKQRDKLVTLGSLFEAAQSKGFVLPPSAARENPPVESYAAEPIAQRGLGRVLVTKVHREYEADPHRELLDMASLDGKDLLSRYEQRHAKFGTTPFDPDGERLRLYPGGVTIWSGYPGAGKTTILRQLICHCLIRGSSVFLASLEEDPANVLVELAAVAAGRQMPDAHQMQWFIDAYAERFRLWGVIGIAQHRRLLAVIRQLAEQGIKHAVIDSLMCLDVPNDDYEAQRRFANLVAATARASRIHIHLVAHPRKQVSADQELDINDVAGAREIGGIADNVIFVRRSASESHDPLAPQTPMCVVVRKQRHRPGVLGQVVGWFNRGWRQFHVEQFPHGPIHYLPEDAYKAYVA